MGAAGSMTLSALGLAARHGKLLLLGGLVLAVAFPSVGEFGKMWLPYCVALTLFIAALRIGPRQALGAARDLRVTVILVTLQQLALPVAIAAGFALTGQAGPLAAVLILMLAGAPISGAPNLSILCGSDPAPALRQLVAGTALLPLTVLPVFWIAPIVDSVDAVIGAAARLLLLIGLAEAVAFAIRAFLLKDLTPRQRDAIDGASAIAMVALVLGLMSAVGPALREAPHLLILNLLGAFIANFGMQVAAALWLERTRWRAMMVPLSISAGNRNIALFLTALPAGVTDPMMLFIGCYQIPMYVTPLLLGRFYQRLEARIAHSSHLVQDGQSTISITEPELERK